MTDIPRTTVWTVRADGAGAREHPDPSLDHVGDVGVNACVQCQRCESVPVARTDELVGQSS